MNTDKIKTLEELHEAIDIVEDARFADDLTKEEKQALEAASVKLRDLERLIIRLKSNELAASLTKDANDLNAMAARIKTSAENLDNVASAIEKAAKVVEVFVNIISTAAGLL